MTGIVSFVGDGVGDPALRTERGAARIAAADHVAADAASSVAFLEELAALAQAGKRVVRLVAGDPLESPVAVAEAGALARAGIPIEVVPGVGARSAAAAFAGVLGPAVRVPAGEVGKVLQGVSPAARITLIAAAGLPGQRVVVGSAADAAARAPALAREARVDALLVAFGEPDEVLRWAERRPLFGKRILVTRAREQAGSAAALLRDAGADPVVVPTIEIHPPADPAPLAKALADLRAGAYAWAVFTSANGVDRTWETLAAAGGDARAFGAARLAAIGPATARALERRGLRADVVAREFRGEALAAALLEAMAGPAGPGEKPGPRVLLARAAKARDVVPDTLRAAGCAVDVAPAYETRSPPREAAESLAAELSSGRLDAVTFTSSSTVENLCDLLGDRTVSLLGKTRVASIGPVTTATAVGRGIRVDVTARDYTVPGLVQALAESYG